MARKKSDRFRFRTLIFLVITVAGAAVLYDIKRNDGQWESSETFKALKRSGVVEYLQNANSRATEGVAWLREKFHERFPGYAEKVVEYSDPYIKLTKDVGKYFCNICDGLKEMALQKYPIIVESIESYAPGLIEQSSKTVQNVWSVSLLYFNRSLDYLKEEVFVGQLAPENVQRIVIDALNTTQQKASEYYYWLYEKVQSTIK